MSEKAKENKDVIDALRGRLVVSCQDYTEVMIRAAIRGGAAGLRVNSPQDVRLAKSVTDLPLIACNKMHFPNSPIYITPSVRAATAVARAGAELVAVDCTPRRRVRESIEDIIAAVHEAGSRVVADLASPEEAPAAVAAGADVLASTLSPNFDPRFIEALVAFGRPVLAEGHIATPEDAKQAIAAGAWAVCVGSAITRPHLLTEQFTSILGE